MISKSSMVVHSRASNVYTLFASFLFVDAKAAADKFACASMSFGKIWVVSISLLYPCRITKVDHFNAVYAVRAVFELEEKKRNHFAKGTLPNVKTEDNC